jgi:hypothetical protein
MSWLPKGFASTGATAEQDDCVFDVLTTGDLDMAVVGALLNLPASKRRNTRK